MKKLFRKKKPFKKMDKQDKTLLGTFIVLTIIVIVLASIAISQKNAQKNENVNIIIPVLEEQTQNEISVDLSSMKPGDNKEYTFKISNYKQEEINKHKINYEIAITKAECVEIELYKGNEKENLLKNKMVVENNILPKNKKTEDEYLLIIRTKTKPSKTDKITLKITS